jgi:hypothetical protein
VPCKIVRLTVGIVSVLEQGRVTGVLSEGPKTEGRGGRITQIQPVKYIYRQ